mmetsp:Transcript_4296/g.6352  ORF Transcript_4296/g.6352 Transcript_4296/m.6352 type:complete len:917 (+) Transcript_4296:3-2753(+)
MGLSVVVVGMRGAGKSSLGLVGAESVGYNFVDMDDFIEDANGGLSCGELIERFGWDGFRDRECVALEQCIGEYKENYVISCGGGIVETEKARQVLRTTLLPVVMVERSIKDIVRYLESKEKRTFSESAARRPAYGQSIEEVYERRYPHFVECSTHTFFMREGDCEWDKCCLEFGTFISNLFFPTGPSPLQRGSVLRLGDGFTPGYVFNGKDGMFIVGDVTYDQLARLRRESRLPVIVDAKSNIQVANTCIRAQVSGLVVDSLEVVAKTRVRKTSLPRTVLVGLSVRIPDKRPTNSQVREVIKTLRGADIDFVNLQAHFDDAACASRICTLLHELCSEGIGCCRIMLDPVSCSGEGYSVACELMRTDFGATVVGPEGGPSKGIIGLYCLFGHPIRLSPSPSMHNAAFAALELNRHYTLCDTLDISRVESVLNNERFMGASVTIPHKETVMPLMDDLTDAARKIGAVNTVTKVEGRLRGDNTDWLGIYNLLHPRLCDKKRDGAILVVGAGGTALAACYCVQQLGFKLFVYNRTFGKASRVAAHFGGQALEDLADLCGDVVGIIGTIPAKSKFVMPDTGVFTRCKPVVLDVAYRPRKTALLSQAESFGCVTFEGIDMLVEQGIEQCLRWTGQRPRFEMEFAARQFYAKTDPECGKYFLFGKPISTSPSPTLHNTGFQLMRLSKCYSLCETDAMATCEDILLDPQFKGGSVTIPLKENMVDRVDQVSPAVKKIGALNTILVKTKEDGSTYLYGDNTDWLGIRNLLQTSKRLEHRGKTALVIGAGGTAMAACYCVKEMGMSLIICNRTKSRAEEVSSRFDGAVISSLQDALDIDCIISTVPSAAALVVPEKLLEDNQPVVLDVAYRPRITPILEQADKFGCETFQGIEMFIEQGLEQLGHFTGRDPPREKLTDAVHKFYNR